jgi:hypothetical protein
MPTPRKNQKQVAQKYAGNRRYASSWNPFRLARIIVAAVIFFAAVIGGWLFLNRAQTSTRLEAFDTSGPISQSHSSIAKDCKQCHDSTVALDPLKPIIATAALDANCEKCHTQHTFHNANVVVDHSCTACHHEHLGAGPMQQVTDLNCQSCHGSADLMAQSAQKASLLPASAFDVVPRDNLLVYYQPPHPAHGYTHVFQSFEGEHPAFQIQTENLTDPNTLKFNHKLHLTGDIPMVDGKKLDCAYCHKPDNRGAYMQPINFGKNCQACHSLQVDPTLADFQIPHPEAGGQTNSVRDFLLTLPTQYATYASEKKGLTDSTQIAAFVTRHMLGIRQRIRNGDDLQRDVFFADARNVYLGKGTPATGEERALFPGCAYCHEVKEGTGQNPIVTKPVTPDRWYVHARFDHAAHSTMSCEACHGQVLASKKTSDVNLPDKASCVTCHSAKGGVVSTCATCHDYHNKAPTTDVATTSALRQMMLGQP